MRLGRSMILFMAAAGVMAAADSPFAGKWKLNTSKTQYAGTTDTFKKLPAGEYEETSGGQSYKFKMDGKEYHTPFGDIVTWKQVDANNFETVYKTGTMVTTMTTKISADGKTLTQVSKGKKPNGENFDSSSTSQRVSGGPGLEGVWKSTEVKPTTEMWDIAANGEDGLTFTLLDFKAVASLKFDGKDGLLTGPTMPKGYALSMKKTGARTFQMTEKMNGKPVFMDDFEVSADGKVLTVVSYPPGVDEKTKGVYDKQ